MSTESSQIKKVRQFEDKCQIIPINCRRNRNHSYLSFLINPVLWNLRRKLQFERQWKIINFSVILIALLKAKEENRSFSNKTCFIWTFISSNFFFFLAKCVIAKKDWQVQWRNALKTDFAKLFCNVYICWHDNIQKVKMWNVSLPHLICASTNFENITFSNFVQMTELSQTPIIQCILHR